jgi:hypothetical protein
MIATNIEVDRAFTGSFRSSDAPSRGLELAVAEPMQAGLRPDVLVISNDEPRTWSARAARHVRSILMAAGVALLVPIGIVVLPIALAVRAVLSATKWRRVSVWK